MVIRSCVLLANQVKVDETLLEFENKDLTSIITPVRTDMLRKLLTEAGYPEEKIKYLHDGFTHGFSIKYEGNLRNVK